MTLGESRAKSFILNDTENDVCIQLVGIFIIAVIAVFLKQTEKLT